MKLLFIVNDLDFFYSHRLELANEAIRRNFNVYILSNKVPKISNTNISYLGIDISRSKTGILENLNSVLKLRKAIKYIDPDIIHNITLKPIIFSNLILFFNSKVSIINAITGLGYLFTKNRNSAVKRIIQALIKLILTKKSSHYIFQNIYDLNEFQKLGVRDNFTLIRGSGVDSKEFGYIAPKQKQKVNITFTGRMLKDKGVIELIQAVNLLPEKIKLKVILNLYGKIDLKNPAHITEAELKKQLSTDFIVWHGQTNKVKQVLKEADIYCLPSYREGLPKSTLEAMAIGRPIVTTNAPGCNDTVINGYNGFKVPVNSPLELSKRLKDLISDQQLRLSMGRKSRILFEKNFTLKQILDQTFDVYKKILKVENLDNNKFKL